MQFSLITSLGLATCWFVLLVTANDTCLYDHHHHQRSNEHQHSHRCDLPVVSTCSEYQTRCYDKQPCVFKRHLDVRDGGREQWNAFILNSTRSMLGMRNDLPIEVSTANSYTGRVIKPMTLAEYANSDFRRHTGNETMYFFGNHQGPEWEQFLLTYPSLMEHSLVTNCVHFPHQTLAFGAGPEQTGVPWHFHGPGFLEVLLGGKRWFLNPPDKPLPAFDPNGTVSTWWAEYQMTSHHHNDTILVCDVRPGESIYFPSRWYHATLNTGHDWNAWMALFV